MLCCPVEAGGCGVIIRAEDIIEMITSDSNASASVGSMYRDIVS